MAVDIERACVNSHVRENTNSWLVECWSNDVMGKTQFGKNALSLAADSTEEWCGTFKQTKFDIFELFSTLICYRFEE